MDRTAYEQHYDLDQQHFWRIAKRRLVLEWLSELLPAKSRRRILDIGGACSVISSDLQRFGHVTVVEPDEASVKLARHELGLDAHCGSLPNRLGVRGLFDLVVLLDVLEHIDDDSAALRAIRQVIAADGVFICTVPAYQCLWSEHDVVLHHYRRYRLNTLRERLREAGFRICRISYYTSLLLPIVGAQRIGSRIRGERKSGYDVRVPRFGLNGFLGGVMSLERQVVKFVDLPFGSATISVCKTAGSETLNPEAIREVLEPAS